MKNSPTAQVLGSNSGAGCNPRGPSTGSPGGRRPDVPTSKWLPAPRNRSCRCAFSVVHTDDQPQVAHSQVLHERAITRPRPSGFFWGAARTQMRQPGRPQQIERLFGAPPSHRPCIRGRCVPTLRCETTDSRLFCVAKLRVLLVYPRSRSGTFVDMTSQFRYKIATHHNERTLTHHIHPSRHRRPLDDATSGMVLLWLATGVGRGDQRWLS